MTDGPVYTLVIGEDFEATVLADYVASLPAAYAPFRDHFTMINPNHAVDAIEGVKPQTVLLGRWSSRAAFDAYYTSAAYQAAKATRDGVGRFTVLVLPDLSAW